MVRAMIAMCFLVLSTGSIGSAQEAAKKDLEKLQGEWVLATLEVNGSDVPIDNLAGTSLTVKGDRYTVRVKDFVLSMQVTLDPGKDPFEIDLLVLDGANKDQIHKGIYRFENGVFRSVRGLSPELGRPRDFGTWPNSGYVMGTWKRK